MKKLDLSKEKYVMKKIFISVSPDKSATYIYPEILKDNSLLEYNMSEHSLTLFEEYFDLQNSLLNHIDQLSNCYFEEEEKIIKDTILKIQNLLQYKKSQINESIAPFCWDIYKDDTIFSHEIDTKVKDDYILILKYK